MNTKKRNQQEVQVPAKSGITDIIARAFTAGAEWEDKDEFLDVIYWMRQIFAVAAGILWGILPLSGILGLLLFFASNSLVVYVYAMVFQKVDEDDFGGIGEILKEGIMTAFAAFLVFWIMLYSALHF